VWESPPLHLEIYTKENMVKSVFQFIERIAPFFLRYSLALILLWIGALKFADPSPVRGLLAASLSFLAFNAFVYVLGALLITVVQSS